MDLRFRFIIAAALLALAVLVSVPQTQADERPQFNREEAVSSAEIAQSDRGYMLTLSDGTEVRLTQARADRRPRQDCLVHIPSLRQRIEQGLRGGALAPIGTAAQSVSLQVRQDPTTGELWCGGAGTGCTIIIN